MHTQYIVGFAFVNLFCRVDDILVLSATPHMPHYVHKVHGQSWQCGSMLTVFCVSLADTNKKVRYRGTMNKVGKNMNRLLFRFESTLYP